MLMAINLDNYRDQFGNLQSQEKLIKDIVSEINNNVPQDSGMIRNSSFISLNSGYGHSSTYGRKIGKSVTIFSMVITVTTNIPTGWLEIGTIASGFRPEDAVRVPMNNGTEWIMGLIEPSGAVRVYSNARTSGQTLSFSTTTYLIP